MKKWICGILSLVLVLSCTVSLAAVRMPVSRGSLTDDADVLSNDASSAIVEYLGDDLTAKRSFKVESERADKQFPLNSIQLSQGVQHVVIAGGVAMENGEQTALRAGKFLRKQY